MQLGGVCGWQDRCVGGSALWTRSLQVELVWPAEGLPLGQQQKAALQELRGGHVAEMQVREAPQEGAPTGSFWAAVASGMAWGSDSGRHGGAGDISKAAGPPEASPCDPSPRGICEARSGVDAGQASHLPRGPGACSELRGTCGVPQGLPVQGAWQVLHVLCIPCCTPKPRGPWCNPGHSPAQTPTKCPLARCPVFFVLVTPDTCCLAVSGTPWL